MSGRSMNITEVFIRRPVMTTLIMLGIVLSGVAGYPTLPVSDLPNVDFPTLQVYANLPGQARRPSPHPSPRQPVGVARDWLVARRAC